MGLFFKDPFDYNFVKKLAEIDEETNTDCDKLAMNELKERFNIFWPKVIFEQYIHRGQVVYCGKREKWSNPKAYKSGWRIRKKHVKFTVLVPEEDFELKLKTKIDFPLAEENLVNLLTSWRIYLGYQCAEIRKLE